MKYKNYSLSQNTKVKLGKIIKVTRLKKFTEHKKEKLIENNPYTKANFCEHNSVCHYHTLTKLETSYIRENSLYHYFLNKLGLSFQVKDKEHIDNIEILTKLAWEVLDLIDNFSKIKKDLLYKKIKNYNFNNDCIAEKYFSLLKYALYVFIDEKKEERIIYDIKPILSIYDYIFKPLAYQTVGYQLYFMQEYKRAENFYLKAISYYKNFNIGIGILYYPLIDIYIKNNNYYEAIKICNQLEEYYILKANKLRLMSIYIHLVNYYLLINSLEFANKYYKEIMYLLNNSDFIPKDKISILQYNWGYYELTHYNVDSALGYFKLSYNNCNNKGNILTIINRILICMDYLKKPLEGLKKYIEEGKKYYIYASDLEKSIFIYFINIFKMKDNELNVNKIVKLLKNDVNEKFLLLYFYEKVS